MTEQDIRIAVWQEALEIVTAATRRYGPLSAVSAVYAKEEIEARMAQECAEKETPVGSHA